MDIQKIFVSKQAGIGDVVLTTPILAGLKKQFPKAAITLMTFPNAVDAINGLPFIDKVFSYDKKRDSVWKVLKNMRGNDLAILLDLQYRPALLSCLAGIPIRIGLEHKRKLWLSHPLAWKPYMDHIYEPYVFADILQQTVGIEIRRSDLNKPFFAEPSIEDQVTTNKLLVEHGLNQGQPYIACSPVTAYFLKNWSSENWKRLFQEIYKVYKIPVVIFGADKSKQQWNFPGAVNVVGNTTLKQAACIIRNARLLVNSCSLPIHIAAAFNIPTVVLYGFGDPERWAPRQNCTVIKTELSCSPCDGYYGSKCTDPVCMKEISVEQVFNACQMILQDS